MYGWLGSLRRQRIIVRIKCKQWAFFKSLLFGGQMTFIFDTFISINFLESFLKINSYQFEIYNVRFQVGIFHVTKSTVAFISILIDTEKIQVQRCQVQCLGQQTMNKMCLVCSFRSLFMKTRQLSSLYFSFQFL